MLLDKGLKACLAQAGLPRAKDSAEGTRGQNVIFVRDDGRARDTLSWKLFIEEYSVPGASPLAPAIFQEQGNKLLARDSRHAGLPYPAWEASSPVSQRTRMGASVDSGRPVGPCTV